MMRDQIIFEKKMSFLQTKCFACLEKEHMTKSCPLIHYTPNRIKVVNRYLKDPGQNSRISFERIPKKSLNSLLGLCEVQKCNTIFRKFSQYYFDFESTLNPINRYEESPNNHKINDNSQQISEGFEENFTRKNKSSTLKFTQMFVKENNSFASIAEKENDSDSSFENNMEASESWGKFEIPSNSLQNFFENKANSEESKAQESKARHRLSINDHIPKRGTPIISEGNLDSMRNSPRSRKSFARNTVLNIFPQENKRNDNSQKANENENFPSKTFINLNENLSQNTLNNLNENRAENNENDAFLKEFEKGMNYKNYFPDFNLQQIIQNFKKKLEKKEREKNFGALKNFKITKGKTNRIKKNKIAPQFEMMVPIKRASSMRKDFKKASNIFVNRNDFFSPNKKFSFYDVVYEVINNQELRKKLFAMKQRKNKKKDGTLIKATD